MPTQKPRRRVRDELAALAGFPPEGIREPFKPSGVSWTQRFPFGTGGENHALPPDSLQPDEAVLLQNFRPTPDGLEVEWGYTEVSTPKTSPLEILNINLYKELDGTAVLIRMDEDELAYWNGSAWAEIAGNGDAMTGDQDDRIRSAMVLNSFIWVNGVDAPKEWQVGDTTYADLTADSNAPSTARHVAAFADRVVFADVGSGGSRNPQRLEWSASGDFTDFTSIGAGGATLQDTSDDAASDDIMAIKVFDEFLVIVRQRSIWLGQRTGVADAPIRFHGSIQGTGAIAEDSVQVCGDAGIIFLGNDNIYLYHPQNREVVPVGEPIRKPFFAALDKTKLDKVRSAYVPSTQQYHLFYPNSGDTWAGQAFVFDVGRMVKEQRFVWWRRPYDNDAVTAAFGGPTTGLGTSAGSFSNAENYLLIGSDGGELFRHLSTATTDDGNAITAIFDTPDFTAGHRTLQMQRLNVAYRGADSGLTIRFAADSTFESAGDTYSLAETSDDRDSIIEAGFWAPQGVYGRSTTIRFSTTGANAGGQAVLYVGYRLGFIPRGDIIGEI